MSERGDFEDRLRGFPRQSMSEQAPPRLQGDTIQQFPGIQVQGMLGGNKYGSPRVCVGNCAS